LASWQLVFWGGFVTCATFVAILTIKNRTWRIYLQPGATRDGTLALTMAIIGFVSLLLYGKGAQLIGDLGTSLGFAGYMSVSIIVANVLGFITGEWKGVGTRPIRWIIAATVVLVLSICVLGFGNSMWTGPAT
jgi:L-rhamnose-H+ transport protein